VISSLSLVSEWGIIPCPKSSFLPPSDAAEPLTARSDSVRYRGTPALARSAAHGGLIRCANGAQKSPENSYNPDYCAAPPPYLGVQRQHARRSAALGFRPAAKAHIPFDLRLRENEVYWCQLPSFRRAVPLPPGGGLLFLVYERKTQRQVCQSLRNDHSPTMLTDSTSVVLQPESRQSRRNPSSRRYASMALISRPAITTSSHLRTAINRR
jgi:hypothetical protein